MEATVLENQMEKKMENEMETGIIYYRTLLVPFIGDIWSLIVCTYALIEGRGRVEGDAKN